MKLLELYNDEDVYEYIKCKIPQNYKINKGLIYENEFLEPEGFILYHIEKDNIIFVDYLFVEDDEELLSDMIKKFDAFVKKKNKKLATQEQVLINMIIITIKMKEEIINQFTDLKYKILKFNDPTCLIFKYI